MATLGECVPPRWSDLASEDDDDFYKTSSPNFSSVRNEWSKTKSDKEDKENDKGNKEKQKHRKEREVRSIAETKQQPQPQSQHQHQQTHTQNKAKTNDEKDVQLQYKWELYYDEGNNRAQTPSEYESGIMSLGSFSSVQTFWQYWNNLNINTFPEGSNLCVFKSGIKPLWEDPQNALGGKWTLLVPKERTFPLVTRVVLAVIGENLDHSPDMCGVVLSIRPKSDSISVWNKSAAISSLVSVTTIQLGNIAEGIPIKYQPHRLVLSNANNPRSPSPKIGVYNRNQKVTPISLDDNPSNSPSSHHPDSAISAAHRTPHSSEINNNNNINNPNTNNNKSAFRKGHQKSQSVSSQSPSRSYSPLITSNTAPSPSPYYDLSLPIPLPQVPYTTPYRPQQSPQLSRSASPKLPLNGILEPPSAIPERAAWKRHKKSASTPVVLDRPHAHKVSPEIDLLLFGPLTTPPPPYRSHKRNSSSDQGNLSGSTTNAPTRRHSKSSSVSVPPSPGSNGSNILSSSMPNVPPPVGNTPPNPRQHHRNKSTDPTSLRRSSLADNNSSSVPPPYPSHKSRRSNNMDSSGDSQSHNRTPSHSSGGEENTTVPSKSPHMNARPKHRKTDLPNVSLSGDTEYSPKHVELLRDDLVYSADEEDEGVSHRPRHNNHSHSRTHSLPKSPSAPPHTKTPPHSPKQHLQQQQQQQQHTRTVETINLDDDSLCISPVSTPSTSPPVSTPSPSTPLIPKSAKTPNTTESKTLSSTKRHAFLLSAVIVFVLSIFLTFAYFNNHQYLSYSSFL